MKKFKEYLGLINENLSSSIKRQLEVLFENLFGNKGRVPNVQIATSGRTHISGKSGISISVNYDFMKKEALDKFIYNIIFLSDIKKAYESQLNKNIITIEKYSCSEELEAMSLKTFNAPKNKIEQILNLMENK